MSCSPVQQDLCSLIFRSIVHFTRYCWSTSNTETRIVFKFRIKFQNEYIFGIVVFKGTLKEVAFPQMSGMVHCPSNTTMVHILKESGVYRTSTFLQINTSRRKNQNVIYLSKSWLILIQKKSTIAGKATFFFFSFFVLKKKKRGKNKDPNLFP